MTLSRIEYLVLLEKEKGLCLDREAFINFLKSHDDFRFDKTFIEYKSEKIIYSIEKVKSSHKNHIVYDIYFEIDTNQIEILERISRTFKTTVASLTDNIFILQDDITLYYSQKAYPIIFHTENMLRKLISKLMYTKDGIDWSKDRTPEDVTKSIRNREESEYLHSIDFSKLSNFLFSENFPRLKQSLINKLKTTKDIKDVNIEDIKNLLPISNWDKYFNPIVNCEKSYLESRWNKITVLRNIIAHNKTFRKHNFNDLEKLYFEIKTPIIEAIESISKVNISDKQLIRMLEAAEIKSHPDSQMFLSSVQHLGFLLGFITDDYRVNKTGLILNSYRLRISLLKDMEIITEKQYMQMHEVFELRNKIVHLEFIPYSEYQNDQTAICGELIVHLRRYINTDLDGE